MTQLFQNLPPIVGLILGLVLLAWLVFVFLVPFMIESIRQSSRKTHEQLVELNRKIDELNAALAEAAARRLPHEPPTQGAAGPARGAQHEKGGKREDRGTGRGRTGSRGRREPTISETDFGNEPRPPSRREPNVK
jgi:hypothetical protein